MEGRTICSRLNGSGYFRFAFAAAAFASIRRFLSRAFMRRTFLRCFNFNLRRFM
jgi:hypothetical protein